MPDLRDDLKSTEEAIERDADQVKELEAEKASLDPDDPRVAALSERIEGLSAGLKGKATAERELTDEIQGSAS